MAQNRFKSENVSMIANTSGRDESAYSKPPPIKRDKWEGLDDPVNDLVMYLDGALWWPARAGKPKSGTVRIDFFGEPPTYEMVPVGSCEPYHSSGIPLNVTSVPNTSKMSKAIRMDHMRAMEDVEVDTLNSGPMTVTL